MEKKRLHSFDILKFIASFFVVYLHTGQPAANLFLSPSRIAVPLFFAISGLFYYSNNKDKLLSKTKKAVKKLTVIYIISLLTYTIYGLYECYINDDFSPIIQISYVKILNLITRCTSPIMPYGFHLWFIIALIETYLLALLIYSKIKNSNTKTILFISMMSYILITVIVKGYIPTIFHTRTLGIIFSNVIFFALPFFILGYYVAENHNNLTKINDKKLITGIILSIIILLWEFQIIGNKTAYFGIIPFVFLILIYSFKHQPEAKIYIFISKLGEKYSLLTYILHPLVIPLFKNDNKLSLLYTVIVFLSTLTISIILKNLYTQIKIRLL